MFQKLGWAVGELGWGGTMLVFLVAEVMCVLTVLSLAAIISNGSMRGGGCVQRERTRRRSLKVPCADRTI